MTTEPTPTTQQPRKTEPPPKWRPWSSPSVQLGVSLVLAIGALVLLLGAPFGAHKATEPNPQSPQGDEIVKLLGHDRIAVANGSALEKKLEVSPAQSVQLTAPVLAVTGSVVARLAPGKEPAEDRWQFNAPEVLSAYTDWQKSRLDVEFNQEQLVKIKKLNKERVDFQTKEVDRLKGLVKIGTDAAKDLAAATTTLIQAEIQGQKEVYEAETNLRVASRARAALERQLQQAGVDPELLAQSPDGSAIVVADVPEAKLAYVKPGQACTARFFGFPETLFPGKVGSLAPTLSRERRTLRVLFVLNDTDARLRPGMFAEIGLGTDPRQTILVPSDGVIHVGRSDYLLVGREAGVWQITEVKVGELHGNRVEIVEGVSAEQPVIGKGAILLKPFIVQALQTGKQTAEKGRP